jgi:hypothetical protein
VLNEEQLPTDNNNNNNNIECVRWSGAVWSDAGCRTLSIADAVAQCECHRGTVVFLLFLCQVVDELDLKCLYIVM